METTEKIFFENVARISVRRHLQRGAVEKKAGLSPGYGSRILKGEKPLTEKCKAGYAEALGVTVEYLCTPHSDEDVESEELTEFFMSILKDTQSKDIFWRIIPEERIEEDAVEELEPLYKTMPFTPDELTPEELRHFAGPDPDPLDFVWVPVKGGRSLNLGRDIEGHRYTKISWVHGVASAKLESVMSRLFLYEVDYETDDGSQSIRNVVEAYLVKGQDNYFLCSSAWAPQGQATLLQTMYQNAFDQATSSRLEEGAHKLIKKYNELKGKG